MIDLPLQADGGVVFDAHRADEESDLPLLHGREALAHGLEQLLTQLVGDHVERRVPRPAFGLEKDEEARAADDVRRHHGFREPRLCLRGDDLGYAAEELVEERPAVLRLDRFELLDVDEDDADLPLVDENFFEPVEHHRNGGQSGGAIEQHVLAERAGRRGGRFGAAAAVE